MIEIVVGHGVVGEALSMTLGDLRRHMTTLLEEQTQSHGTPTLIQAAHGLQDFGLVHCRAQRRDIALEAGINVRADREGVHGVGEGMKVTQGKAVHALHRHSRQWAQALGLGRQGEDSCSHEIIGTLPETTVVVRFVFK